MFNSLQVYKAVNIAFLVGWPHERVFLTDTQLPHIKKVNIMDSVLLTMISVISVIGCSLSAYIILKIYEDRPDGIKFNG